MGSAIIEIDRMSNNSIVMSKAFISDFSNRSSMLQLISSRKHRFHLAPSLNLLRSIVCVCSSEGSVMEPNGTCISCGAGP